MSLQNKVNIRNVTIPAVGGFGDSTIDAYNSSVKAVWNFSNGAFQTDATGNGYSWTQYYDMPTQDAGGINGYCALNNNGRGGPRWNSPGSDVPGASEPFTMWVWVKPTVQLADSKNCYFFNFWQNYDNLNTYLKYNNTGGSYTFTAYLPSGTSCSASKTLSVDNWHLVMLVADPVTTNKLTIYIDGAFLVDTALASNGSIAQQDFHLTRTNDSDPSEFTNWYFDSFVYLKGAAVSQAAITAIWNGGIGKFYSGPITAASYVQPRIEIRKRLEVTPFVNLGGINYNYVQINVDGPPWVAYGSTSQSSFWFRVVDLSGPGDITGYTCLNGDATTNIVRIANSGEGWTLFNNTRGAVNFAIRTWFDNYHTGYIQYTTGINTPTVHKEVAIRPVDL